MDTTLDNATKEDFSPLVEDHHLFPIRYPMCLGQSFLLAGIDDAEAKKVFIKVAE